MPIPAFTIDGILPPYVGPHGPGGAPEDMTPYVVSATEVVATLGISSQRQIILRHWLNHRAALRRIGFTRGYQWLDGSFVEQKDPQDLDVVTFTYRPTHAKDNTALSALITANIDIFYRPLVKKAFMLDAFFLDFEGSAEALVSVSRYYLGLFSHRRGDDLWKGMLQVRLEDVTDDQTALSALGGAAIIPAVPSSTPSMTGASP